MKRWTLLKGISEDTVETGESSKAELLADSDKHILAEENTKFVLKATGTEKSGNITINLLYGTSLIEIENKLSEESYFEVTTPNATLSVRGTTFEVNYDEERYKKQELQLQRQQQRRFTILFCQLQQ